jgi:3-hydroxypropanoate dehydrogenase
MAYELATLDRLEHLDEAGTRLLFTDARTVNSFDSTPVGDDELQAIWELAKWPPTSANTQPLRVLFVRTDEGRRKLLPHLSEGNQPKAASAPAIAVLAVDRRFHDNIPAVFPHRPEMREVFEADEIRRDEHARFNAAMQAAYFILAVRARGLAAGPMGGFDSEGVDAEFFPDGRWHSILVVNIGHPGENPWFERLPRLEDDQVLAWS